MFVAFADLHAHNFKDFSSLTDRFGAQLSVLDQIIALAKQFNATILFAGDLFHKRSYIYAPLFNAIAERIANSECPWVAIPGNHDRHDGKEHSLGALGHFPNVTLLHNKGVEVISDGKLFRIYGLAPGAQPPQDLRCDILLAHGMLIGARTPTGFEFPHGYSRTDLERHATLTILGDIHKPQQHGNVWIPGSPMMHDFGDVGDEKSVLLIDNDLGVKTIALQAPRFFDLTEDTLTPELLEKGDASNYYRLKLKAGANDDTVETLRSKFPNFVILREPPEQKKSRAEIAAQAAPVDILASYYDYAKPPIARDVFLKEGAQWLAQGTKQVEMGGLARRVEFERVWVENFMSFAHADFKFEEGVFLVSGLSDDPSAASNGVGKSVLFVDAILWCIYDTLARASVKSKDRLIHDPQKTGKARNCAVGLAIKLGDDRYEFIRARKHAKYGTGATIIKNGQPYQCDDPSEEIARIFAIPMDVLLNVAIFPQRSLRPNYKPFLACTDSERKEILETALSLGAYGVTYDLVLDALKGLVQTISNSDRTLEEKRASLKLQQDSVATLTTEREAFFAGRLAKTTACKQALAALAPVQFDEAAWMKANADVAAAQATLNALGTEPGKSEQKLWDDALARLAGAQLRLRNAKAAGPEPLSPEARQEKGEALEDLRWHERDRQAALDAIPELADPSAELRRIESELRMADTAQLANDAAALNRKEAEIHAKLQKPLARCHACQQTLNADAEQAARKDLERQLQEAAQGAASLAASILDVKTRREGLESRKVALLDEQRKRTARQVERGTIAAVLTQIGTKITELSNELSADEQARAKAQNAQATTNAAVIEEQVAGEAAARCEAAVKAARESYHKAYTEALAVQTKAEAAVQSLKCAREQWDLWATEKARLDAELDVLSQPAVFPSEGALATARATVTAITGDIDNVTAVRATAACSKKVLDTLERAFSPQGIVSLALDGFLTEFQRITSQLCNDMTLGSIQIRYDTQIELKRKSSDGQAISRDKFDVVVEKSSGAEGADLLSGSEQQKVNLIVEQALAQLVAQHSNVWINLRVYDEVFDGMNATSADYVVQSLLKPEVGVTKLVISHRSELASTFDRRLVVRMEKGVSCLV